MNQSGKKFEILEHTADIRIRVFGSSPKELFGNALFAMAYIQKPSELEKNPKPIVERNIAVESLDTSTLLIDFLSEVLSLSDTYQEVYFEVKFYDFSDKSLTVQVSGIKIGEFDEDIKAVTYHEVEVKEVEPGKWESLIVFDI